MSKLGVAVCDWDGRILGLALSISTSAFKRVYLCVEDRHILYRQENVHEAIKFLKDKKLEVILDPWGVSNMFAGEATSGGNHTFVDWLKFAETTKADGILLDEPKQIAKLESTIALARELAPSKTLELAVQPEKLEKLEECLGNENVDSVSVSTYIFEKEMAEMTLEKLIVRVQNWSKIIPPNASVWVQTWKIPEDKEWVPDMLVFLWRYYGENRDINIWAWEACKTVSAIRPFNSYLVWKNLTQNSLNLTKK